MTEEKQLKKKNKEIAAAEKKLLSVTKKLETAEKKLKTTVEKQAELKKVKKGDDYVRTAETEIWGITVKARTLGTLSGSKASDIKVLASKPDKSIKDLDLKLLNKEAEMLIKKSQPLPEELEAVKLEIETRGNAKIAYSVPVNVFHRDKQIVGNDGKHPPCIGGHMPVGAFRLAAVNSFAREFMIYTKVTAHAGWRSKDFLKDYVQTKENHILLYKDAEMKEMIEDSDIEMEGQNPVGDVKGFAEYETISAPAYFQFTMFFNPKGFFPNLKNKQLVIDCFEHMVHLGLGSRRGVNYGQWEVLNMELVGRPGETLYDKFIKGKVS